MTGCVVCAAYAQSSPAAQDIKTASAMVINTIRALGVILALLCIMAARNGHAMGYGIAAFVFTACAVRADLVATALGWS
jgi:hypothetical protein